MPQAQADCDRREALSRQLEARGWCYGEDAEYGYQATWAECKATAYDNELTPYEQAEADRLANAYERDRLIQAEIERQLEERRRAQERRDRAALDLIH